MFEKKDFIERIAFWADKSGQWAAANPDYKPGDQAPESFEYHTWCDPSDTVLQFTIYAYIGGQKMVIWKGFHYWHELRGKSVYLSLGTQGQVCNGENRNGHEMYFEILMTNGQVMYIRNLDEIENENEVKATSQTIVEGAWRPMNGLHWKRI
ncbi:MAG TPA: hypothetical protein VD993_15275 [Chitinophagaceae bacterium]|nr:hypothetical protein [Chitinophagaceae bacterium]